MISPRILWNFFFLVLVLLAGIGVLLAKHHAVAKEEELASLQKQIYEEQRQLHVLKAEWTYLSDPSRLTRNIKKLTALKATKGGQIISLAYLPQENMRVAAKRSLKSSRNSGIQQVSYPLSVQE